MAVFLNLERGRVEWMYTVRIYRDDSSRLGALRSKIGNLCDARACDFCYPKEMRDAFKGCFMKEGLRMNGMQTPRRGESGKTSRRR